MLPAHAAALLALLDDAERQRYRTYRHRPSAELFLLAHGLCRLALSAQCPRFGPESWEFERRQPFGKPQLRAPAAGLSFNISHTAQLAACAVQPGLTDLGLDVESSHRPPLSAALIEQYFTPKERQDLLVAADPAATALCLWRAKEAYLKALGCGLHESPQQVEIELRQPRARVAHRQTPLAPGPPDFGIAWGQLHGPYGFALARRQPQDAWDWRSVHASTTWFAVQIASHGKNSLDPKR